ncbi:MAG: relaxase/mobilization nuclease domain-containing protein [Planctomycetes bacterium]|nr:relaxase/mobilization nuclease domain-containing protein [Planctomycetota bacterium]
MIPTITKKGTSFKGAAAYYLHDKDAQTNERIDFTQTQNLATDNPEMAWKMMAYTAMHQSEIKQAAGGVSKGRKLTQPVYAYSLAWHPTQEPTKEHMIESGLKTLKILGLCEHEAILVAHNDADHKHIHLIVNRVHPETGVAAKVSNDRLKLSKWAEGYERDHGEILCEERVKNNERRRNGEYVKNREKLNKAEFYRWQREKVNQAFAQRQKDGKNLSAIHKKQRDKLFSIKERLIEERRKELKESNRPKWASIYKRQNQENRKLEEIQGSALSRVVHYIKNRNQEKKQGYSLDKQGLLSGSFSVIIDRNKLKKIQINKHEQERKVFAGKIAEQSRNVLKQSNSKYARDLETLKANQAKESGLMKGRHSEESKKLAKDITSGKTKEEFDRIKRAKALRDEYNKRSSGKPTDSRKEFNEKADFRVARYMKEEREKSARLKDEFNKKKPPPPDIQKDFRVARYMKQQQEQERADNLKKAQGIKKEFNSSRDMKEDKENERDRDRLTDRDTDREPS